MNTSSRRTFLAVTGTGAAAAGAATLLPASLAGAGHQGAVMIDGADFDPAAGGLLSDSVLMACVTDLSGGEVTVINGASEITVTDPVLGQRIAQLSRKEA